MARYLTSDNKLRMRIFGAGLIVLGTGAGALTFWRAVDDSAPARRDWTTQRDRPGATGDSGAGRRSEPAHSGASRIAGAGGHFGPSRKNVELVGKIRLTNTRGGIGDVSALGNHAYLAAFRPECTGRQGARGTGVHVVDISDPARPKKVSFIPAHPNSYVGEGVHVIRVDTRYFKGDILIHNNEPCNPLAPYMGGVSLWDVSDPTSPRPLARGVGDNTPAKSPNIRGVSSSHSAQGFTIARKAYVVLVDNEEPGNVDILDITNPRKPSQVSERGFGDWPKAQSHLANGNIVYHHDMQVEQIAGHTYLLASYWDAGWVLLDIDDPSKPRFVDDFDYSTPDPLTGLDIAEGNAHQAFWSSNDDFILGTDEDFSPRRVLFRISSDGGDRSFGAGAFTWTRALSKQFPSGLRGRTIWGGSGCTEDLNGNGRSDRAEVPPASRLRARRAEAKVVVFGRGVCFFSTKIESGQLAGYDAVIVGQSHEGTRRGLLPDSFVCGAQGHTFPIEVSAICIGHRAMHVLFDDRPEYVARESFAVGRDMPPIGADGNAITATTTFDGWGYIHLIDARTLREIDAYAAPQALDPRLAKGAGTLSVHEIKTDPRPDVNLAYSAYYDAGLRVLRFGGDGIREVGRFDKGNEFWGTFPHLLRTDPNRDGLDIDAGRPLLLLSDRHSGLWIFRYTGR